MPPKKALDQESRDALIARAKKAGVPHAERLTRVELLDELTKRETSDPARRREARGLLGRARDLIASLLEKGLNLPDAASRVRDLAVPDMPPAPPPVATVTLAEIYAAQGHVDRAVTVLEEVLAQEPEHTHAALLLDKLTAKLAVDRPVRTALDATEPPAPAGASETAQALWPVRAEVAAEPEPEGPGKGPIPMLDDVPLPARYGVNEVVVLPVDPTTALLYWEIADGSDAVLRVIAKVGSEVTVRDVLPVASIGETYVYGLPAGATLMAEIVFRKADALSVSASNVVSVPWDAPSARVASEVVVWGAPVPTTHPGHAGGVIAGAIPFAGDDAASAPLRAMQLSAAIAKALAEPPGALPHDRLPEPEAFQPEGSSENARRKLGSSERLAAAAP